MFDSIRPTRRLEAREAEAEVEAVIDLEGEAGGVVRLTVSAENRCGVRGRGRGRWCWRWRVSLSDKQLSGLVK